MLVLKIILFLTLFNFVIGFRPPWMFMGRPLSGFRQDGNINSLNETEPEYFEQLLDHFNKNGTTWKQRYWNNTEYANDENEVHFLILGGDFEASSFDVLYDKYPHVKYAIECNATLWTLEHRFYGESQPLGNLKTKNLKYLESHQAVADIASFISSKNAELNLSNPKWIIFGGGYSGTLGIWFKRMYPDLSVGVVASSAPVNFRLDFYDYMQFSESLIESYDSQCSQNIKGAFKNFTDFLRRGDGFTEVMSRTFKFNPNLISLKYTYEDVGFLYSSIISYFQASLQYNNANAFQNNIGISLYCYDMAWIYYHHPPYFMNIARSLNYTISYLTGITWNGMDINYADFVSYLKDSSNTDPKQSSTRAWLWQSCNEFGSFPTTNGAKSIFGNYISYNFYVEICSDVFGPKYSIVKIQNGLRKIQSNYAFDSNFQGANIIVTKNSFDPWSILAFENPNDPTVITYEINGTGHCADMAPIADSDSVELMVYREFVLQKIKEWISA